MHFDAVIFDLDGVITNTAGVHAAAWKSLFDDYLRRKAEGDKKSFRPFELQTDYLSYVDGKPRYQGVQSFLASRGIQLPYGNPLDDPEQETICGLGNKKNILFQRILQKEGVEVFNSTVKLIRKLKAEGIKIAVVSSSKNCQSILKTTGLENLFEARLDGSTAESLGLKGKPHPDIFLRGAEMLKAEVKRSIVVEDAISGVQAGKAGKFGLVIGIARKNNRAELKENGADLVVSDLAEIGIAELNSRFQSISLPFFLPSALKCQGEIKQTLSGRKTAVFLDYDGTLTPIAARPDLALLSEEMRQGLKQLSNYCPLAVVSGRALNDVRGLIKIEGIYYAGNHGFEITGPGNSQLKYEQGTAFWAEIESISQKLALKIKEIKGALLENKKFSLSVHYRLVAQEQVPRLETILDELLKAYPRLKKHPGKKVFEVRPAIDWDKGKAVLWMLKALNLGRDLLPFYLGDDTTDEDAFRALKGRGIGILVSQTVRKSAASYSLKNTREVRLFLELLTGFLKEQK